jgi:hypothetical protein
MQFVEHDGAWARMLEDVLGLWRRVRERTAEFFSREGIPVLCEYVSGLIVPKLQKG